MCTSITPPQMSGQMIAYAISAVRVLISSDKRVLLSSSSPLPPSPPAEKATAATTYVAARPRWGAGMIYL